MGTEVCTSAKRCGVDPASRWTIQPASARIAASKPDGSNWDGFGGAPDPYVRLFCPASMGTETSATSEASNTTSPTWTNGSCRLTAQQLTTTGFAFDAFDGDGFFGGADDLIAPKTTKVLTEMDLLSGAVTHGPVSSLTSVRFVITQTP